MFTTRKFAGVLAIAALAALVPHAGAVAAMTDRDRAVPHYDHILVIVEENKTYAAVLDHGDAPTLSDLAATYGVAAQMFAETHPSEPNYVAMVGGDTFGIHDDDSWYCVAGSTQPNCKGSDAPGFVTHLIDGPSLATQLRAKGLGWRAYLEDIPAPGSLAIFSPETETAPAALYAAKHTGFTNFAGVHADANLTQELVGFDALRADLRSGNVPAFAFIVPNQCNEMHGIGSPKAPEDCRKDAGPLIRRGDAEVHDLVAAIQASPIWTTGNTAIVITWDEDGKDGRVPGTPQACCTIDAHNPGGGHIPTIVITNHGPRKFVDPTPYDHYSLLRTVEDAFGLDGHLRHADDPGVQPMTPLFAY
jgi:phosphatidylinositol-3-phosphatase